VSLHQTGPGHYEARFPTREVGAYLLNLAELQNGRPQASLAVGASVNYSPEFASGAPNQGLLRRITEVTGGRMLEPTDEEANPFLHDRRKTYQPRDLFEGLLKLAILLFPIDVGVRRIDLDRAEWAKGMRKLRGWLWFWRGEPRTPEADESLAALLARRDQIRAKHTATPGVAPRADLFQPAQPVSPAAPEPEPETATAVPSAPPTSASPASPMTPPASTASRLLEAKRRAQQRRR
jgi:hypothetical protein